LLDFEFYKIKEREVNHQEEEEVYLEEPDISGGIEYIDYIIEYGVNCEDDEEEA
jgi:hypothetical protein